MVSPDHYINGRVHLNSADFRAGQVLLVIDVVNVVILYDREHPSQMPYNTGLSAVMNIAAVFLKASRPIKASVSIAIKK